MRAVCSIQTTYSVNMHHVDRAAFLEGDKIANERIWLAQPWGRIVFRRGNQSGCVHESFGP